MTWDRPASSRCFLLPCVFFSPRRTVGMSVSTVSGSMPFHTRPYAIYHLSSVSLTDLVVSLTCSITNIIDYRNCWCLSQNAWVQKRDSSLHLQISFVNSINLIENAWDKITVHVPTFCLLFFPKRYSILTNLKHVYVVLGFINNLETI